MHPDLSPAPGPRGRTALIAALALVIAAASALRFVGLDHLLIWYDEVFSLVLVNGHAQEDAVQALYSGILMAPKEVLHFQERDPSLGWSDTARALLGHPEHPPLYYLLARLALELPVEPIVALRGCAALAGLMLPLAAFWLMRELFGRNQIGSWVAATLIACSPMLFLYSQEGRQYSLWLLWILASSGALVRALRTDRTRVWWLYGGLLTLGLYTHLLFALVLVAHGVFALVHIGSSGLDPVVIRRRLWRALAAMGLPVLLFTPWLLEVVGSMERYNAHLNWMSLPIGSDQIIDAWVRHAIRAFVDLDPTRPGLPEMLLLPLLFWAVAWFLWHAPRPAVWLLPLIALVAVAVVIGPDLMTGGRRSLHVRYALPGVLALLLMVGWSIGDLLSGRAVFARRGAGLVLAGLVALGVLSMSVNLRATTWWNKYSSAPNVYVAELLNKGEAPLVLFSDVGVGPVELISLAHLLDDHVRTWGERPAEPLPDLGAYSDVVALTPSPRLQAAMTVVGRLEPVAQSRQWIRVVSLPTDAGPNP